MSIFGLVCDRKRSRDYLALFFSLQCGLTETSNVGKKVEVGFFFFFLRRRAEVAPGYGVITFFCFCFCFSNFFFFFRFSVSNRRREDFHTKPPPFFRIERLIDDLRGHSSLLMPCGNHIADVAGDAIDPLALYRCDIRDRVTVTIITSVAINRDSAV